MIESEFQDEVLALLEEKYGKEKIVLEPTLKGETTVYPDIVVFSDDELTIPFLLVEYSSLRTTHRTHRDLDEISEAVSSTDAVYGALLAPDVQFIFSGSGPAYQTYADFPEIGDEESMSMRTVQSLAELDFLVNRSLEAQNNVLSESGQKHQGVDKLLESLHLLLEARRKDIPNQDNIDRETLSELYASISERYEWYQKGQVLDPQLLTVTSCLFRGYDLIETDDQILESLFELTGDDRRGGLYSTPLEVAQQMVQLTAPEPGDTVLDPAAAQGTILSLAAAKGAKGIGIEINLSVLSLAAFYLDLLNRDVKLFPGDFFEIESDSDQLPKSFDHIIADPPLGMNLQKENIPYAEERSNLKSEEAFLVKGLSLLENGGTITITVPPGFLYSVRSEWIRTTVLEEFQLDSVIQIVDGPMYRYTSIDTAFITITNRSPSTEHKVQYEIVESPEDPESALADAVTAVNSGTANSILQSDLEGSMNLRMMEDQHAVRETLENEFSKLIELRSVADIQSGTPPRELVETKEEDTITYLSISDISEGKSRHGNRYLPRDEARVIADDSSVLLSTIGKHTHTHIPSDPVAPAQDLAVLSFDSPDEALVYETFLSSDMGIQQLDALKKGSRLRVNISDLRELNVPYYTPKEVQEIAASIRSHQQKIMELENEQEQLERERDALAEQASDLLTGGEDDE